MDIEKIREATARTAPAVEARRRRTENARKAKAERVKKLRLEAAAAELRAAGWIVAEVSTRSEVAEMIDRVVDFEQTIRAEWGDDDDLNTSQRLADLLGIRIGKALA